MLFFAVFRELIGAQKAQLELADGACIRDAIAALEAQHPSIRELRGRYRVALNHAFVDDSTGLANDDELALIPPVAGGNDARHVLLTDQPLSLDRCVSAVMAPEMGGIATFIGTVRRQNHGAIIESLEYEAYADMATRVMAELIAVIEGEIPEARLAVEHRVGTLHVGDLAVVIAAAAPHRAEAFTACRALIDRLKQSVPIWKKETGSNGAEWIGLGP